MAGILHMHDVLGLNLDRREMHLVRVYSYFRQSVSQSGCDSSSRHMISRRQKFFPHPPVNCVDVVVNIHLFYLCLVYGGRHAKS